MPSYDLENSLLRRQSRKYLERQATLKHTQFHPNIFDATMYLIPIFLMHTVMEYIEGCTIGESITKQRDPLLESIVEHVVHGIVFGVN